MSETTNAQYHAIFIEHELNAIAGKIGLIRIYARVAYPEMDNEVIGQTHRLDKVVKELREELERLNVSFNYDKPINPVRDPRS